MLAREEYNEVCYDFNMRRGYLVLACAAGVLALLVLAGRAHAPAISSLPAITPRMTSSNLMLTSSAFVDGGSIPSRFTCDGERDLSPALAISGVPEGAKSLALIMDDPDIPAHAKRSDFQEFDHWILFDLPADTKEIPEGGIQAGTAGVNSVGENAYAGPCPPAQYEPSEHRYIFTLYALDTVFGWPAGATKAQLLAAMQGHVLAQTTLTGRYKRTTQQ